MPGMCPIVGQVRPSVSTGCLAHLPPLTKRWFSRRVTRKEKSQGCCCLLVKILSLCSSQINQGTTRWVEGRIILRNECQRSCKKLGRVQLGKSTLQRSIEFQSKLRVKEDMVGRATTAIIGPRS